MKKSFTLVEVLVVSTIVMIMAAVGIFSYYTNLNQRSRNIRRRTDLETIRNALEMYRSNNNVYPENLNQLTSPTPYLSMPFDPIPHKYRYFYQRINNFDYVLAAYYENSGQACSQNFSQLVCGIGQYSNVICNFCIGPYGRK